MCCNVERDTINENSLKCLTLRLYPGKSRVYKVPAPSLLSLLPPPPPPRLYNQHNFQKLHQFLPLQTYKMMKNRAFALGRFPKWRGHSGVVPRRISPFLLSMLTTVIGDHGCSCGSSCQCPAGSCNCPVRDIPSFDDVWLTRPLYVLRRNKSPIWAR
ncbi:hypothetical protein N7449_009828 [Penicillium cf. viridicatum]|uniref:Uncharacterized protein n=1 Tax=Penicillium cf. viridicatum TaxID=2972119 RepID=A0A9W9M309_9EURO|nr:hypothetical protein N7449_009828 [Penicillium cf. viridicatum]